MRVAAKQLSLRTAQEFNALRIDQLQAKALATAKGDTVEVKRNRKLLRALRSVGRTDTAGTDRQGCGAARERRDLHARNGAGRKVGQGADVAVCKLVGGNRGHGQRDLLQCLLAPLGGNEDDAIVSSLGILRHGGTGQDHGGHNGGGNQKQ